MEETLHIVNGDSLAGSLRQTGRAHKIACWREALYLGPLLITNDKNFSALREEYWQKRSNQQPNWLLYDNNSVRSYRNLTSFALFLQIPSLDSTTSAAWDMLNASQVAKLFGTEQQVTAEQMEDAERAWEVFASSDPNLMRKFLSEPCSLSYAKRALNIHVRQFPQLPTLLGEIEVTLLRCINRLQTPSIYRVLGEMIGTYDGDYGLSDSAALERLLLLSNDKRRPLMFIREGKETKWNPKKIRETQVQLSESGKKILESGK